MTRERIHVDRSATAWAIKRFVDREATFEFVAWTRDARSVDGIPFDMRGAELGHHNGRCTLEALIEQQELTDPALLRMAAIIRGADLPYEGDRPIECAGVVAFFDGIRDTSTTDAERLERGGALCEALYAYCAVA